MQLEGAFAGRSAGDHVCIYWRMRLQFLVLFTTFQNRNGSFLSIHYLRLPLSIQWHPVPAISHSVFPRFVQEEDIPDILVEAYESTHSHITVSCSGLHQAVPHKVLLCFAFAFWSPY